MSNRRPSDLWFGAMLRWERLANVCPELRKQMESDLLAVSHPLTELSSIQTHGAVVLLGAAYQAFGFNVLGPLGRQLLGIHFSSRCGIPVQVSSPWLESVAFNLLEDLNVLQVVCGEPDWKLVDLGLATDLWQRVFCSDEQEGDLLGLDVFESQSLAALRQQAAGALRAMRSGGDPGPSAMGAGAGGVGRTEWPQVMHETFRRVALSAAANPLRLLSWRIQGVSQIQETRHEVKFILRSPDATGVDDVGPSGLAGALAWLLISLSPCHPRTGRPQEQLESPLPWSGLKLCLQADVARGHFAAAGFDLPHVAADDDRQFKQDPRNPRTGACDPLKGHDPRHTPSLGEVVMTARNLGLIFEIYPRPGKPAYGLTSAGMRILAPFEGLLREWLGDLTRGPGADEPSQRAVEEHKVVPKKTPKKTAQPSRTHGEAAARRPKASKTSALLRKVS